EDDAVGRDDDAGPGQHGTAQRLSLFRGGAAADALDDAAHRRAKPGEAALIARAQIDDAIAGIAVRCRDLLRAPEEVFLQRAGAGVGVADNVDVVAAAT